MTRPLLFAAASAALLGCSYDFDRFDAREVAAPPADDAASDAGADVESDATLDAGADAVVDDAATPDAPTVAACTEADSVLDPSSGHCYFVAPGTSHAWSTASTQCTDVGAHLVTIGSDAEQRLVAPFAAARSQWIGLSSDGSGTFTWVDGAPLSYAAWDNGEPAFSTSRCVTLSATAGAWATSRCSSVATALCEREP